MSFAICRTEKIKNWATLAKSVGHNMRTTNEDRSHLNANAPEPLRILFGDANWEKDWKTQVKGMHLRELQLGQAHTIAREFFLGMSPEWMKGKSPQDLNDWASANIEWLKKRFGPERVKFAVMHLDEQTPHIAAYVVPLKADPKNRGNGWTLSDRELGLGGSKDALSKLQDEYAEAMKSFNLQRGIKGSKATHQKTQAWRNEMWKMEKELARIKSSITVTTPTPATLTDRIQIEEYAKTVAKKAADDTIKQLMPYINAGKEAQKLKKDIKKLEKDVEDLKTIIERLEPLANIFKDLIEAVLGHPIALNTLEGMKTAQMAVKAIINKITGRKLKKLPPELVAAEAPPNVVLSGTTSKRPRGLFPPHPSK